MLSSTFHKPILLLSLMTASATLWAASGTDNPQPTHFRYYSASRFTPLEFGPPQPDHSDSEAGKNASTGWRAAPHFKQVFQAQSYLKDHGITFGGWLQLDGSSVASGGLPDALGFDGQYLFDFATNIDTKELFGLPGGTALVDVQSHNGPNVVGRQFLPIQDPDNMDAYQQTSVDRAWYQQDLFHEKLQLQVGIMYVDDKFLTVPYGGNFTSLDFFSDASISTFVLPTFPKGAFGADAVFLPIKGLYFSGGVWSDHSTELPYDPGGKLYLTEEGWSGSWNHLPYKLQLGAWRDTGTFQRYRGGTMDHASGVYLVASQKWWQPKPSTDRGIGMFFQFGTAPQEVAPVRKHIGAGIAWTGPFDARPKDEFGLAFSDALLTPLNNYAHSFENEIEAYYLFDLSHGWTIKPDMEYWQNPGGGTTPNTLLGLVRITYTFGAGGG